MDIVYDYVIVDSKLLAFNNYHRRQHPYNMLKVLADSFKFNRIRFKRVLYAADWGKSEYRLALQNDYKGHRKEVQSRSTQAEQDRRVAFLLNYEKMFHLFDYVGFNLQSLSNKVEADDMYNAIRTLKPEANILLVSLDEDYYYHVNTTDDGKGITHLLKYTKNTLFTSQEQVEELYGFDGNTLLHMNSIVGQAKDAIYGLQNFGKARFKKHLQGKPTDEWWSILKELFDKGTYGIGMHPKAKFDTPFQQYLHNLVMMSPMPLDAHKAEDVKYIKDAITREPNNSNFEEFIGKSFDLFDGCPPITQEDFRLLKYGTEGN